MSVSATCSEPARPAHGIETGKLLVLIWIATVATYLLASFARGTDMSTDDAMRLVEVRDFLAGQRWFDLTQYRLSPPGGVAMHWSRLVDVPLAALIRIGETVLPTALAERVATVVWPAALLLVFLIGIARLARELAGEAAARLALIFAALMAPVLQHFRPGAIDHHNLQLVLLVWSLALAARAPARPRDLALAGALSALSLAIGVEMAPAIAALGGAIALRWIVCGEPARRATTALRARSRGGDARPVRRHGAARALRGGGLRRAVDRARDGGGGRRRRPRAAHGDAAIGIADDPARRRARARRGGGGDAGVGVPGLPRRSLCASR